MKHLFTFIKESLNIFEGGNAVKSNPIPAVIAPKVYDEIEKKVHSISKFKDIDMAALGSIGKKADDQTNGDIDVALAAYNAGPANVDEWLKNRKYSDDGKKLKSIPYKETREYVIKVNKQRKKYEEIY